MGIYLLFTSLMGIESCGCVIVSCSNKAEGLIIGVGVSERKLFPWFMRIHHLFTSLMGIENCGCMIVYLVQIRPKALLLGSDFTERK